MEVRNKDFGSVLMRVHGLTVWQLQSKHVAIKKALKEREEGVTTATVIRRFSQRTRILRMT